MYTSLVVVALTGTAATPVTPASAGLAWQENYSTAREQGRREHKPVAVFVGSGPAGQKEVSADGAMSAEAARLLGRHYVAVYVDTTRPTGRRLAADLGLKEGLVLSSRGGLEQAFRVEGKLSNRDLEDQLRGHAEGRPLVARSVTPAPVVYAQAPAVYSSAVAPAYAAPAVAPPTAVAAPPPFFNPGGYGGFGGYGGGFGGGFGGFSRGGNC
jgi:hypothetical protein